MAKQLLFSLVFIGFSITLFSQRLPEKNIKIIAFTDSAKGKKIGRGECWDLAQAALDNAEAMWTRPYDFGKLVKKDQEILSGDIIQFENVVLKYPNGMTSNFKHHTAIIYSVLNKKKYVIAEQNSEGRRFVVLSEIDLNYLRKGSFRIYRPQ